MEHQVSNLVSHHVHIRLDLASRGIARILHFGSRAILTNLKPIGTSVRTNDISVSMTKADALSAESTAADYNDHSISMSCLHLYLKCKLLILQSNMAALGMLDGVQCNFCCRPRTKPARVSCNGMAIYSTKAAKPSDLLVLDSRPHRANIMPTQITVARPLCSSTTSAGFLEAV